MQAQVMTIVWNENAEEPMFLSTGISDPTFYMGEIDFLEKVLDALKKKSKYGTRFILVPCFLLFYLLFS